MNIITVPGKKSIVELSIDENMSIPNQEVEEKYSLIYRVLAPGVNSLVVCEHQDIQIDDLLLCDDELDTFKARSGDIDAIARVTKNALPEKDAERIPII